MVSKEDFIDWFKRERNRRKQEKINRKALICNENLDVGGTVKRSIIKIILSIILCLIAFTNAITAGKYSWLISIYWLVVTIYWLSAIRYN